VSNTPPSESTSVPQQTKAILEVVTASADETFSLAEQIGRQLVGGEIFLLRGDLGSGKTMFSKGLAAGLEIRRLRIWDWKRFSPTRKE
jgi:tRNA A37 threonylcarbamoyladenosine biosynthesis protein TsaE